MSILNLYTLCIIDLYIYKYVERERERVGCISKSFKTNETGKTHEPPWAEYSCANPEPPNSKYRSPQLLLRNGEMCSGLDSSLILTVLFNLQQSVQCQHLFGKDEIKTTKANSHTTTW